VVATVDGHPIHLSDLDAAVQELPPQARSMPPQQLYPILVDQLIDREALVLEARKQNLQKDPAVQTAMARADDQVLQNALLRRDIAPQLTDANLRAVYDKEIGSKPGEEEVQASHILVSSQAQAQDIINQLNKGADFATLAKKDSIDPGASIGGELGWFSQDQMVPAFANAAFALKPGEYTKTPVQSQFGWHVILCEGKRTAPAPALADVQQTIRQNLADAAIKATLAAARSKVKIEIYNTNGTPGPQNAPAQ
jgi:peptidyl-prolyl cis-trans isomerase C